jgi:hypothetical protein
MTAQWQVAMTTWTVDHALDQGYNNGQAYRLRTTKFVTSLFNSEPGFPKWYANTGILYLGQYNADYSVTWHTTLADVYNDTIVRGDPRRLPFNGYHGLELRLPLIAGEALGVPGATAGFNYLMGEGDADVKGMNVYVANRSGWSISRGSMGLSTGGGNVIAPVPTPPPATNTAPAAPKNVRVSGD